MAMKDCVIAVDGTQRELAAHGTPDFPIGYYHDDLGKYDVQWHWHEEWEAAVILEGTALITVGNEKYILHAGEGFFVNSQILHGCWDPEGTCSKFHSIVFHPKLLGGSLDSVFFREYIQPLLANHGLESLHLKPEVPWQQAFLLGIEDVWQACARADYGYEFEVRSKLSRLLLLLLGNVPEVRNLPSTKRQRDGERIKGMLQFIHDHCAEPLSTQTIAGSISVSESECLRCFRATIGTTPIRYVRDYRIQKAVHLLTTTELPVSAIAERCGFQDVSYFTKTFREMKGCAPTAFRRK